MWATAQAVSFVRMVVRLVVFGLMADRMSLATVLELSEIDQPFQCAEDQCQSVYKHSGTEYVDPGISNKLSKSLSYSFPRDRPMS
jgi:hypothetical protein